MFNQWINPATKGGVDHQRWDITIEQSVCPTMNGECSESSNQVVKNGTMVIEMCCHPLMYPLHIGDIGLGEF